MQCVSTHISVLANFMQGNNDKILSWPFTREVAFNQLGDKNYFTETVTYPKDKDRAANRRVLNGERGSERGSRYGLFKFISP